MHDPIGSTLDPTAAPVVPAPQPSLSADPPTPAESQPTPVAVPDAIEEPPAQDLAADSPALADWKDALREEFECWLDTVDTIPEPAESDDANQADAPDLYAFYEQLAAANAEGRKSNRRTAEAFSQWGDTLAKFDGDLRLLREQLARQPAAADDALPRPWCLALVEMLDRLHRLATAFAAPPGKSWWGGDARWRNAWNTQQQGFSILVGHVEALLQKAGVTRIPTLRERFDPATMSAVATEPSAQVPTQTVLEEIAPGYRLRGELLRVAQVKVSTAK